MRIHPNLKYALTVILLLSAKNAFQQTGQAFELNSFHEYQRPNANQIFDTTCAAKLQRVLDSMRTVPPGYMGASASVMLPCYGTWSGVSGYSHDTIRINPGMKFGIASQTKLFISTLMLKLSEMNILSIDDSLYKWLPNFLYVDTTITIRQLLNHTSGLYNFSLHPLFNTVMLSDTGRAWTPEEILANFMNLPSAPKGQWYYSNTNYLLAGLIIKAAVNTSVSNKLREMISDPFELENTFFAYEEAVPQTVSHVKWNNIQYKYPVTSWYSSARSAAAMFSTPENLTRFYSLLFSKSIINQASLNQLLGFVPAGSAGYGLGIVRFDENGRTTYGHDGYWLYRSVTTYDSASGFSISIEINSDYADPMPVHTALHSAVINNCLHLIPPSSNLKLTVLLEGSYDSLTNQIWEDSLRVYLRDVSFPFAYIDSASVALDSIGKGTCSFMNSSKNSPFYIQLVHRNSIETWSGSPQQFSGHLLAYDFSIDRSQAYGSNLKQVDSNPPRFAIYSGDVNQDGAADLTDMVIVFNDAYSFKIGYGISDLNNDGFVDLTDLSIAVNNSNALINAIKP